MVAILSESVGDIMLQSVGRALELFGLEVADIPRCARIKAHKSKAE